MLYSNEMNQIVRAHFQDNSNWEERRVDVICNIPVIGEVTESVVYFFHPQKKAILFPAPLTTAEGTSTDGYEPSYQAAIDAVLLAEDIEPQDQYSVSASLLGKAAIGRHYVSFHRDTSGSMTIFDSSAMDPILFLNSPDNPTFGEMIWSIVMTPYRAIRLWLGYDRTLVDEFLGGPVQINRLRTQPFYDFVSCGYHTTGAVMAMSELLEQDECVDLAAIKNRIDEKGSLDLHAEAIFLEPTNQGNVDNATRALKTLPEIDGEENAEYQQEEEDLTVPDVSRKTSRSERKSDNLYAPQQQDKTGHIPKSPLKR